MSLERPGSGLDFPRLRAGGFVWFFSNLQIAFDLVPRVHPVLRGGGEAVLLAEEEEGLGVGVAVAVGVGVGEEGLDAAGNDALRG